MVILLVFLLLLFILLVPIRVKLTLHFSKGYYYIKFYNILLFSPNKGVINKLLKKLSIKNSAKVSNEQNSKKFRFIPKRYAPSHKEVNLKNLSIIKLYKNLSTNKFKPKFRLKGDVNFELEDAAITAIAYGIASNSIPLLYFSFSRILKVKNFSLQINPHFTGKNLFNITITSIISFNIAQIIYILLLTTKSFENKREVNP